MSALTRLTSRMGPLAGWIVALGVLLVGSELLYHKHPYFALEKIPGFYGLFSVLAALALIGVAAAVGSALRRPEDTYD
ncbi:MAG: hypothetical protein SVU69_03200 [Pseudomonadota bacterium]|nr:hypothetical protein [Pseudomonadota bacterium]